MLGESALEYVVDARERLVKVSETVRVGVRVIGKESRMGRVKVFCVVQAEGRQHLCIPPPPPPPPSLESL